MKCIQCHMSDKDGIITHTKGCVEYMNPDHKTNVIDINVFRNRIIDQERAKLVAQITRLEFDVITKLATRFKISEKDVLQLWGDHIGEQWSDEDVD